MAAAVFISPSPHDPLVRMATAARRAPLASIPNATNSPHRFLTTSGSKRSRAQANVSQQENERPLKRQATDKIVAEHGPATPNRPVPNTMVEAKVFERGNGASGSTAFQKKLVAARDQRSGLRVNKTTEQATKTDSIQQWQKHYRKIFPGFSFFFDNVSSDIQARFVRHIAVLGAKEEKFFSKSVTHIVTTRSIPPEMDTDKIEPSTSTSDENPPTVNPSLLDSRNGLQGRSQPATLRRDAAHSQDILQRGREMGMKIWTTDKLQRILATIFDEPNAQGNHTRTVSTVTRGVQEDLSQVLRNEKLIAAERDLTSVTRELTHFKGPFIYVHDIDEKYRPTMVREYPKVARRQDGEWPQFRSANVGKCPFVEDPSFKREMEQERCRRKIQEEAPRQKETQVKMEPPRRVSPRKALKEVNNPAAPPATINPGLLNRAPSSRNDTHLSFPPMPENRTFDFVRPPLLQMPREPAASGIQRSKLTSAIQSNMISSTAAAGVKAANSKEVNDLKRRALERTHTGSLSTIGSIPSSHRMNDLAGVLKNARAPAPQRAAKSKAQEKLGGIQEETDPYAEEIEAERQARAARKKKQQQAAQKESKPGYCENCRDKYEDFEEHIISRKHRKFAMTQSNWTELDALLVLLQET